jgi:hypothetical protein
MSKYYYFMATLPALQASVATPPFSHAEFLSKAEAALSAKDFALLSCASLTIPTDGSVPAGARSSELLRRYHHWELSLRNELARLRAGRMQKPFDKYLKPGELEYDGVRAAQAAFQAEDPLQGELVIERERWGFLEMLAVNKYFDIEYIIAYSLMLQVLERRARFDTDKGNEGYRTVYRSVLETADYRDESGENK